MAHKTDDEISIRRRGNMFAEKYPDFMSWLDGDTWELDIETEIVDPLPQFRAALYYQARCFGQRLATKTLTRAGDRKVLLVRAYED